MENSICKFMPVKDNSGNIKASRFVFETDFKNLKQPFFSEIYYMYLVIGGDGILRFEGREYTLERGTLFFTFPGEFFTIEADDNFKYIYIGFLGAGAQDLLESLKVDINSAVFPDFSHIIDLWQSAIVRVNNTNSNFLSKSVLLYTLSFCATEDDDVYSSKNDEDIFPVIVDYIDNHFFEADISLKKLSEIFSYNEKYLSNLFKKKMNIGFNKYLNRLRIQHAWNLLEQGEASVSRVAFLCGYSDSLYFSKVFKKSTGVSPSEYLKKI